MRVPSCSPFPAEIGHGVARTHQQNVQRLATADVENLEDLLSEPTPGVIATLGRLDGAIVVLGAGGKMGPTLARMAKRASDQAGSKRRVIAVPFRTGAPHAHV